MQSLRHLAIFTAAALTPLISNAQTDGELSNQSYTEQDVENLEYATVVSSDGSYSNNSSSETETQEITIFSTTETSTVETSSETNQVSSDAELQALIEESLAYNESAETSNAISATEKEEAVTQPEKGIDSRFYLTPMVTATLLNDRDNNHRSHADQDDTIIGGQLILGTAISDYFNFEINAWTNSIDPVGGLGDYDRTGVGANLLWNLTANTSAFRPFLLAGVGIQRTEVANYRGTTDYTAQNEVYDAGLGAHIRLSNALSLRPEVRYRWENFDRPTNGEEEHQEIQFGLGLAFALGALQQPVEPVDEPILANPEPIVVLDSDSDGVFDDVDACPGTAIGLSVDTQGCELVTEAAVPTCNNEIVTDVECLPQQMAVVLFGLDSAVLSNKGKATLTRLAKQMDAVSNFDVIVGGHADSVGDHEYNLALSFRRAEAVKVFLIHQGVDPQRIRTASFGETEPDADNDTLEGRQRNRRVVAEKIAF